MAFTNRVPNLAFEAPTPDQAADVATGQTPTATAPPVSALGGLETPLSRKTFFGAPGSGLNI